jgi:selenide,water dikinase
MIEKRDIGIRIFSDKVPFFPKIRGLAEMGILPAGLYRNKNFRMPLIDISPGCPEWRSTFFLTRKLGRVAFRTSRRPR